MIDTETIVLTALCRSLGMRPPVRVHRVGEALLIRCEAHGQAPSVLEPAPRGKIIVFGTPPASMLPLLGLRFQPALPPLSGLDDAAPATGDLPYSESPAHLVYAQSADGTGHPLLDGLSPGMRRRPFTRYDYADEWNNLGFGRIRTDDSPWAAQGGLRPDGALELAGICSQGDSGSQYHGSYLTLYDTAEASALWCARPVGPVDSTEWSVVERFLSDWRAGDLPCLPCLRQTPAGCRCVVTMRLDCDEDVASARDLFDWYAKEGIPFSLALKTGLAIGPEDRRLLEDARAAGGTLLSHSHSHPRDWGANFEEALSEAETSRRRFTELWPDRPPADLAVSPFHTNPPYAVEALARAGFTGLVSGIIHNDPEYLLGRAGVVPFAEGIVSLSQQSMLHGDVYRRQGRGVAAHIAAFAAQYAAGGIFGYLDHPFSTRYQYDWESAKERLAAHQALVAAIRGCEGVCFWSQGRCFAFLKTLAGIELQGFADGTVAEACPDRPSPDRPSTDGVWCRYMGRDHVL